MGLKRLALWYACTSASLLLADDANLLQLSPALEQFSEKRVIEVVRVQGENPKFAGDDPKTAPGRKVDWKPRMWAPYLNSLMQNVAIAANNIEQGKALVAARNFYIRIGRKDPQSPDLILSADEAWDILLPADNLYWNNGDTWHTDVLMEADNGFGKLRVLKKGEQKAALLEAWPTRVGTWMSWSEKNGDFALVPSKLGNRSFTAVVVPRRVFNTDITDIVVLRDMAFAEALVARILKTDGPAAAGNAAFALAEQLWNSSETDHITESGKLFQKAAENWQAGKKGALAKRARYREVATLLLVGYLMSSEQDNPFNPNPSEVKRTNEVGRGLLGKALTMKEELGENAVDASLTGDLCLLLAQAAFGVDSRVAMDYIAKALAASEPMTGSGKVQALALRAQAKQKNGDFDGAQADLDYMDSILKAEEESLDAAVTAGGGRHKNIDPLARPDLYMRANDWNSESEQLRFLRLQGIGTKPK